MCEEINVVLWPNKTQETHLITFRGVGEHSAIQEDDYSHLI